MTDAKIQALLERYEMVIGLEIHCQLATQTKAFSSASTAYGGTPNAQVNEVDLGLPGALPALNAEAIRLAARAGLAMGCEIHQWSQFARKNYFYPDLPKGYQISQHLHPLCTDGEVVIDLEDDTEKTIRVERIHMEEDAGKSTHLDGVSFSMVDLNRAGVPLIEIVSRPDLRSPEEAVAYMKEIHTIVTHLDVCDGNMEEGSFRCDANISIRPRGSEELGTRAEIKNVNSFKFVKDALYYEFQRQIALVEAGEAVVQQTRLYNPELGETFALRAKEEAHDYRYFPEPDLPPLMLSMDFIHEVRDALPELPRARRARYQRVYGLSEYDAKLLSETRALTALFEEAIAAYGKNPKGVANWVINDVTRALKTLRDPAELKVQPAQLAALVRLVDDSVISGRAAKDVFEVMLETGDDPATIVEARGLRQIDDSSSLAPAVESVLEQFPEKVAEYLGGRDGLLGFFVGQVMRATRGKANPQLVNALLLERLVAPPTEQESADGEDVQTAVAPVRWVGDLATGYLEMLDQRKLPAEELWHEMSKVEHIASGIRDMIIRGAPAIGIAAAYGVALAARTLRDEHETVEALRAALEPVFPQLADTRPTAVNLFWALDRAQAVVDADHESVGALVQALFDEADFIFRDDRANNLTMGKLGAALFPEDARVLTHCNTGGLATGGYGTALGVLRAAHAAGTLAHVWIDETRPYLQGARLTAWECMKDGLPCTLITDNMAAFFMQRGEVDAVIVGADRIAANGDTANKIGTYGLAVLCAYHKIPFYVAAPVSTIDRTLPDGSGIPIEQRSAREVTHVRGRAIAPKDVPVAHPAFDVTPGELITAIITERGVVHAPFDEGIGALFSEDDA